MVASSTELTKIREIVIVVIRSKKIFLFTLVYSQ